MEQHPGRSGVLPLANELDAFASRILLIAAAERTIDVQYYIWRDDITGNLLLRALLDAAQRGVRVRLLLDDNGTSGLDRKLALLNAQDDIEVRLFNPFVQRRFKARGFLTDFNRLNRRMHNKSLTIDGQATIVGGRNIGDEYFGASEGVTFTDLDVMVVSDAVDEVSRDFDLYWNSASAYPLEKLVHVPERKLRAQSLDTRPDPASLARRKIYVDAARQSDFIRNLRSRRLDFQWVPVRMVSDDPAKVLDKAPPDAQLLPRLARLLGRPEKTVDLISPYFVPTQQGVDAFATLARQGVRVRVLTNALEATDVAAVHAGYMKYREPLLEHGIELHEMQRQRSRDLPREKAGPFGSSGSSLHAKTFAVDGERVFVGSFNFDPRSAQLNTELGFVIESAFMAQGVANAFEHDIPHLAYRLKLAGKRDIVWHESTPDGERQLDKEPESSLWRRGYVKFLSRLPIDHLL
ncbi:phospholipase D-like domain-containing protein [Luteimonas sp. e5]